MFATSVVAPGPVTSLRIAGFILYVGTTGGVAALSLDDPRHPAAPIGTSAVVAVGPSVNGMAVSAILAPGQAIDAADVVVSMMPGQTWLIVLDTSGDLWGLKLDGRKSVKERCFPNPTTAGCLLDLSFMDATIMGRDPSFDPVSGTFIDPADPNPLVADPSSGTKVGGVVQPFFHQIRTILTGGKRLAPPATWEAIGTLTGRRLRDAFMPGAGVLSLSVMQAMRSVRLCETTAAATTASGLGQLGYPSGASCMAIGSSARVAPACPSAIVGGCALRRAVQRAAR